MSRTKHRRYETLLREDTRRSSRPRLTKGPTVPLYNKSNFDYAEGGLLHNWAAWLHDYCGYQKQKKRRRTRKILKRLGRRIVRQREKQMLRAEESTSL